MADMRVNPSRNIFAGRVTESVGARWHLAGTVQLVRRWHPTWYASNPRPNCLNLIRKSDALSSSIKHAITLGQVLPKVEITTPQGRLNLVNARIVGSTPATYSGGAKHSQSVDTHELERVSFTFQKIEYGNKGSGAAFSDDWNSYPP